jgi:hypothetical protein
MDGERKLSAPGAQQLAHMHLLRGGCLLGQLCPKCYGVAADELVLHPSWHGLLNKKILQEKAVEATKEKEEKRGKLKPEEQEGMPQHRQFGIAVMKSVAEIGTKSAMKSSIKTLHERTSHIPQKTPKWNISRSTNKMLHTDTTARAQGTRVTGTHAREATNNH